MTRDEAQHIIAEAILKTPANLGDVDETAWRIATALDAIGLLAFASTWERVSPSQRRLASQAAHDIATEAVRILQSQQLRGIDPTVPLKQRAQQPNSGNVTLTAAPGNFGAAFGPQKGDD